MYGKKLIPSIIRCFHKKTCVLMDCVNKVKTELLLHMVWLIRNISKNGVIVNIVKYLLDLETSHSKDFIKKLSDLSAAQEKLLSTKTHLWPGQQLSFTAAPTWTNQKWARAEYQPITAHQPAAEQAGLALAHAAVSGVTRRAQQQPGVGLNSRASNEGSRRFHNHGEGPYF